MKKIISMLILLLMLTSCSQKIGSEVALPNTEDDNAPTQTQQQDEQQDEQAENKEEDKTTAQNIEDELPTDTTATEQQPEQTKTDSENGDVVISGKVESVNTATYFDLDKLWNDADYIVVGSPAQSYDEATQYLLDNFNKPTDFSNISIAHSYSVRPFNVTKVYKGEDMNLKEIAVCEHVLTKDGEMQVIDGSYPTEKNSEYILFLFKSNTDENQYFPLLYQGKYSLNDSENKEQKNISQDMYKQVKEKFKDEIK